MNIAICTNMNGIGLTRDYELLSDFLHKRGDSVSGYQFDAPAEAIPKHDLAIFLEVIPRAYLGLAVEKWVFMNPEWCKPDILDLARRHCSRVFTKTREAQRIIEPLIPGKTFYVGFLTRDQYDPSVVREKKFLHIGGNSSLRGTQAVLDAWKWTRYGKELDAELTIISRTVKEQSPSDRVRIFETVDEQQLKFLQNSHYFHLFPSGTEGFGHAVHEARSVGAVLLTTAAPPMSEIDGSFFIPARSKRSYGLATVYDVSALDIHETVLEMQKWDISAMQIARSRTLFHMDNLQFEKAFSEHLAPTVEVLSSATPAVRSGGQSVAFLGNFRAPESTENMIAWALEQRLDMDVLKLQENEVGLETIKEVTRQADFFLWVRTPDWLRVGESQMSEFLESLRCKDVPSISIHLDKFWGIPEREARIGYHPFWKTQFVFTADGSRQEEFKSRSVNHFWMQPAVSEVYCHPGVYQPAYDCDVGFVGAGAYHAEYPFRGQLIRFLQETYGERFKHVMDLRGHGLNDFYASCKVVVGDCIFAGTPYYWSDRLPETCGRAGFLLHPDVDGIELNVPLYKPQDLDDLHEQIEYWLPRHVERRKRRHELMEDVILTDTWTERLREIFWTVRNDGRE